MKKLRLIYVSSFVIVITLVSFMLYSTLHQESEPATLTSQSLIRGENLSIVQLVISNKEGHEVSYTICTSVDGSSLACFLQPVGNWKMFTYRHYFYPEKWEEKEINVLVYREDEKEPVDNTTYHVPEPSR